MRNPLISVIVPIYNVEKYIHNCIDSILNQTYSNLEIILVDDGSPDNCPQICDDYAVKDKRINIIHQKNSGLSVARNVALDMCTGEYIAFVDSDDWLEPQAYETSMNFMLQSNLDIVFYTANIIENNIVTEVRFSFYKNKTVLPPKTLIQLTLEDEIGGQSWLKLYHKDCWKNVRFPKGRLYEDLSVSFYPFVNAKRNIGFLDIPLYNYRMNPKGISLSENPEKPYHIFLGFTEHYMYAKNHFKESESRCLELALTHALGFYNQQLLSSQKRCKNYMPNVENWLLTNKTQILRCKDISIQKKATVSMINLNKNIYQILYRIFKKIKSLLRR